MQQLSYRGLASYYDSLNTVKDYRAETEFISDLLAKHDAKTVLDIGCGTGTHMKHLEHHGFRCTGIDLSQDMVYIARNKVHGDLYCADMRTFDLYKQFDAVICMYASFNHLLNIEDAKCAIRTMRRHLAPGFVLIDLHNPQSDGNKTTQASNLTRVMEWSIDPATRIETTRMKFHIAGKEFKDEHKMRIYSIDDMIGLLEEQGFEDICTFHDFTNYPATRSSKNIEVFGRIK